MPATARKLGQYLIDEQVLSQEALLQMLHLQQQQGGRLGDWLTAQRLLSPLKLYQLLSRQHRLPLIDLQKYPCDPALLDYRSIDAYLSHGYIPWQCHEGELILACTDPSAMKLEKLCAQSDQPIRLVLCTPRDLRGALEQRFGERLEHDSRTRILRESPDYSAFHTLSGGQRFFLFLLTAFLSFAFTSWPEPMLLASLIGINVIYLLTIGFKYWLYYTPLRRHRSEWQSLSDAELPVYSILIPLYREVESVPRLLAAIRALDYPKHKLDVKLVLEKDDHATHRALLAASPEPYFDIIRVPHSHPRTKPKACSYALHYALGEFVTIYDAEDQPEPVQLKKAVAAFRAAPDNVICLQARLNYYNWNESWLSRLFAIEYASLFDRMLPALERRAIPIPLGGTSNHVHLARLRGVRDWDPYNVTEDADLGMRLALMGYKTQMLDSVTLEEAPITLSPWIKQRSRWIKGYLQTWLVHMRQPIKARQQLGAYGFWGFHLMIGGPCFVFLLSPFLWLFSGIWLAGGFRSEIGNGLMLLSYSSFALGYCCHFQLAQAAIRRWRWPGMTASALLYPFYWFLHSVAALRALWQLIFNPHYWDKTSHGVTRYRPKLLDKTDSTR